MPGSHEIDRGCNQPNNKRGSLTLRQYIGLLAPNALSYKEFNEWAEERAKDPKPLTLREYVGVMPFPNIDDVVDLGKRAGRGVQRLWNSVTVQNPQPPSLEPENHGSMLTRDIKALSAGLVTGIVTYTTTAVTLEMMGVSKDTATIAGFAVMVPTMTAAYLLAHRR